MTIRVVCRFCGSKIDAGDSLLGQVRKCPKCKNEITIEPAGAKAVTVPQAVPVPASVEVDNSAGMSLNSKFIFRLRPYYIYLIISYERVIAYWKMADGWQLNIGTGFVNAKRNNSSIPEHGSYIFVEGIVENTEEKGQRLVGIRFFELSGRSILVPLGKSDTDILEKVTRKATINANHKRLILQFIRQNYFSEFTEDSPEIAEFLTNQDFHSREIGKVEERETSPLEM